MKLESSLDRPPALLHLAPILDVMGLMVVFYLLGSTFIHHSGISIQLPTSASQLPPLASSHVVLVTAGTPPVVVFDREQISYDALLEKLGAEERPEDARESIYFKIDKRISNGKTMTILNAAAQGGYKVNWATDLQTVSRVTEEGEVAP